MIRTINLGGLLMLIYIWYNNYKWMILPNNRNVVSRIFVNFIEVLPQVIITFFFLTLMIIYVKSFFTNKKNRILDGITIILFYIGTSIAINILMLEPSTTFMLFQIYHPIPIEFKYHFLESCLNYYIEEYKPQMMRNPVMLTNFRDYLKIHLDDAILLQMNASDLNEYSKKLLHEFSITNDITFQKTIQNYSNLICVSLIVTYILVKSLSYFGFI